MIRYDKNAFSKYLYNALDKLHIQYRIFLIHTINPNWREVLYAEHEEE